MLNVAVGLEGGVAMALPGPDEGVNVPFSNEVALVLLSAEVGMNVAETVELIGAPVESEDGVLGTPPVGNGKPDGTIEMPVG